MYLYILYRCIEARVFQGAALVEEYTYTSQKLHCIMFFDLYIYTPVNYVPKVCG